MNVLPAILCGGLGFLAAWFLIPLLRRRTTPVGPSGAGRGFHHTHSAPVSRLGGVALAASFLLLATIGFVFFPAEGEALRTRWTVVGTSLGMFLLGLWDDLRGLDAKRKLLWQVLIASIAWGASPDHLEMVKNPLTGVTHSLGAWGLVPTVIWLVAMTNLINLIDGIDGLAAGISLMLMALLTYVGWCYQQPFYVICALGMCGALLGFLCYNFPPAKIYMGDGGAYLLGYLIGIISLTHSHKGTVAAALIAPLFALALPILDVGLAILRRTTQGLPIFRADRRHIHHRLQEKGFSRTRTLLILYAISLAGLALAFGVVLLQRQVIPLLLGLCGLLAVLALRFLLSHRSWLALGLQWSSSPEMRKETQYALVLNQWLALEAERSESLEALWGDFTFMARKLGFHSLRWVHRDGERAWQAPGERLPPERLLRARHDLASQVSARLEFTAPEEAMHPEVFKVVSELAAEAWHKAWVGWHRLNVVTEGEAPATTTARVKARRAKGGLFSSTA